MTLIHLLQSNVHGNPSSNMHELARSSVLTLHLIEPTIGFNQVAIHDTTPDVNAPTVLRIDRLLPMRIYL